MGQFRDRMAADLAFRGAAQSTCLMCLRFACAFVVFHMRPPTELGTDARARMAAPPSSDQEP